jgi:hypothetical protein
MVFKKQTEDALNMLSKASSAMIAAVATAVNESESKEVAYVECFPLYTEDRVIKYNEDGDLVMFDEYDNELVPIDHLSADDLQDICKYLLRE